MHGIAKALRSSFAWRFWERKVKRHFELSKYQEKQQASYKKDKKKNSKHLAALKRIITPYSSKYQTNNPK